MQELYLNNFLSVVLSYTANLANSMLESTLLLLLLTSIAPITILSFVLLSELEYGLMMFLYLKVIS